jgi:peptidoglycan/LPS O-acetylase OafA/YrhL
VPVEAFIIMSGYVTHYAYMGKPYDTRARVLRFYARRFGAILFSYYGSWLVMLVFATMACLTGSCIGGTEGLSPLGYLAYGAASLLMVQSFEPIRPYFPNGPAWTISTMGLLWLLYPALQALLRRPLSRSPFAVAGVACALTQLPVLGCFLFGGGSHWFFVSERQYLWLYHFPACRLGDFVLGMALAQALADGRGRQEWARWGLASDGAVLLVWLLCAFVPVDRRGRAFPSREGWEPLFVSLLQPAIGEGGGRGGGGGWGGGRGGGWG